MGILNLVLLAGGVVLFGIGYQRARRPWSRYQELKLQDENVARYERWRGGTRTQEKTGASVAMQILRRQAQREALIAVLGVVLIIAAFAIR